MISIEKILRERAGEAQAALDYYLSYEKLGENTLTDAMRYSTLGGGKRIRAFLTLEFARLFGQKSEAARPCAAAVEMIHAYSLIHDDLPCMDDDDMRRSKPSCHRAFSEDIALLAGDTLLTYAFEVLCSNEYLSERRKCLCVSALASLAGASGMTGGQFIDLSGAVASYDELKILHQKKTGALITAASLLGYYSAVEKPNVDTVRLITKYGMCLGLAFQITDDLLDVQSSSEALGKPVGSDEKNGRVTSLSFMSVSEAQDEAQRLTLDAATAISEFPDSDTLCALPIYLLKREK